MIDDHNKEIEKEKNIETLNYDPYDKVYMSQATKISSLENSISLCQLFGSLFGMIFLITLAIQTSLKSPFSNFIILSFLLSAIVSFTIAGNIYLKLKDLFDNIERKVNLYFTKNKNMELDSFSNSSLPNEVNFGSIFSYIIINITSLGLICYSVLITLKVELYFNNLITFNLIAIPLYFSIITSLIYFLFILPAFLQNKFYSLSLMIIGYFISGSAILIWLNQKLDMNDNNYYSIIFIPLLIILLIQSILYFIEVLNYNSEVENKITTKIFNLISIIILIVSIILISLKLDNIFNIPLYISIGMLLSVYTYITYEYFLLNENAKEEDY